ncbi:MAG: DUF3575 domain-containing protein [Bacteroidota bacterium]|nr:DUF3575 domain-containing protein [Bacteroidota bacterium]
MNKSQLIPTFLTIILLSSISLYAQVQTELPDSGYKRNVIKWNLTPFILFSKKNINLSYERVLSPYRSFSVNAGYFELHKMALLDSFNIDKVTKKKGFNVSGEYRFYFKNRNKRMTPDGLYWGIYSSFYHTQVGMDINVIDNPDIQGSLLFEGKINVLNAGVELGYQFVIKERLTLDLIFVGPSLSMYNRELTLDGDISSEEYEEYLQVIHDILVGMFPGLEQLTGEGFLNVSGANLSFGYGFRYLFQIGYRF